MDQEPRDSSIATITPILRRGSISASTGAFNWRVRRITLRNADYYETLYIG